MTTLSLTLAFLAILALVWWNQHQKNITYESNILSLKKGIRAMAQIDDLTTALNDNTTQLGLLTDAVAKIPPASVPVDLTAAITSAQAQNATLKDLVAKVTALAPAPTA